MSSCDEQEVAEVVGAELRLEAVDGGALRAGHHPGVADEHVEHRVVLQEAVGEGADAGQVGQVELAQVEVGVGHRRRGSPPWRRRPW